MALPTECVCGASMDSQYNCVRAICPNEVREIALKMRDEGMFSLEGWGGVSQLLDELEDR